jgi:hypothetical protein
VRFQKIFGTILLLGFLGFLAYEFSFFISGQDDALLMGLLAIVIVLILVVLVGRVLSN